MSRWLRVSKEILKEDFNIVADGIRQGLSEARIVDRLRALKGYTIEEAFDIYWDAKKQYELNFTQVKNDLMSGTSTGKSVDSIREKNDVQNTEAFNIYYNNKDFFESK